MDNEVGLMATTDYGTPLVDAVGDTQTAMATGTTGTTPAGTEALDTAAQNQAQGAIATNNATNATTNTTTTTTTGTTGTAGTTTPTTNTAKGSTGTPTFNADYLNSYINALGGGIDHTSDIEAMYKGLLDSNLAQLEAANKINQSEYQATRDQLVEDYNKQVNASTIDYERNRYNNNLQAQMNGLNTGTGSQIQLALNNQYQSNQNALRSAQIKAQAEIDRAVANLNVQYQSDISTAIATNDYEKAAKLYEDKINREEQMLNYYNTLTTEISTRASYGDFSMMEEFYGKDAADVAKDYWSASNPDAAYQQGYITAGEYHNLTGEWPYGYDPWGSSGSDNNDYNPFYDSWYGTFVKAKDKVGGSLNLSHNKKEYDAARKIADS